MKPSTREQLHIALGSQRPIPASIDEAAGHPVKVSVEDHFHFRQSLAAPRPADEIDELIDELRKIEEEAKNR